MRSTLRRPLALAAMVGLLMMPGAPAHAQPGDRGPSAASHRVMRCELSPHHRMDLLAEPTGGEGSEGDKGHKGDDTVVLHTRLHGKVEPAFKPDASGRPPSGHLAVHLCLQGVMVYAMRGEGWVRGAVLRRRPGSHRLERLDFTDTSAPYGLYVNDDEIRVVVPRRGRAQYTVYSTRTGQGRPSNILPSGRMFAFHALQ